VVKIEKREESHLLLILFAKVIFASRRVALILLSGLTVCSPLAFLIFPSAKLAASEFILFEVKF